MLIKIISGLGFIGGIIALWVSLFASNAYIEDFTKELKYEPLANLLAVIPDYRVGLCLIAMFDLWLSYALWSLKKVAWFICFWGNTLSLATLIINLIILAINKTPLDIFQKVAIAIATFITLFYYYYWRTRGPFFRY